MLTAVAFVPTPPLLVPELAGAATAETADLRAACLAAVGLLAAAAPDWTAIGLNRRDAVVEPDAHGSWAGFGAEVGVALGPRPAPEPAIDLPLPALVAGWLRDRAAPQASVRLRLYGAETPAERCAVLGRELVATDDPTALLVLGDGCTTLTERAPGAFDARAAALQRTIATALTQADVDALAHLDVTLCGQLGVSGRVPWQVAAAATGEGWRGRSLYSGAPFGVGYEVALWQR